MGKLYTLIAFFLLLQACTGIQETPFMEGSELSQKEKKQQRAELYFSMGKSFVDHGRPIEATENFQTALSYEPNHYRARFALGKILIKRGFLSLGLENIKKTLEIKEDYTEARNFLAYYYYKNSNFKKAKELVDISAQDLVYKNQEETWSLKLKTDAVYLSPKKLKPTIIKALSTPVISCLYRTDLAKTLYKFKHYDLSLAAARQADDICIEANQKNHLAFLKGLIFIKKKNFFVADKIFSKIKTQDEKLKNSIANTKHALRNKMLLRK